MTRANNETESRSSEKINKIDKFLLKLNKEKNLNNQHWEEKRSYHCRFYSY